MVDVADINRGGVDLPRQFSPFDLVVIRKASELRKTALYFGRVLNCQNAVVIDIAAQSADIHLIQSLRQAGIGAADIRVFQADKSVLLHVIDGVVKLKRIAAGILLKDPVAEHAVDDPLLLRTAVGGLNKHPVNLIVRKVNIQLVIDFRIEIFKIIIFVIHVFFVKFVFICILRQAEAFALSQSDNAEARALLCRRVEVSEVEENTQLGDVFIHVEGYGAAHENCVSPHAVLVKCAAEGKVHISAIADLKLPAAA